MIKQFRANLLEIKYEFLNRNGWIGVVFSPIILMTVVIIAIKDLLYESFSSTTIGLFTVSITLVCIGIFNSITIICSIRAKIKVQYIQGMSIKSFVWANVVFQFCKSLIQALIACSLFVKLGMLCCNNFPNNGLNLPLYIEFYIIIFLTIFAADMLGMLISAWSKDTVFAMTLMPGFLVFEMVFSNALFPLPDFGNNILGELTSLSICKWSTSLLGRVFDF